MPVVMTDHDGTYYTICYACTGEASEGQSELTEIIECRKPELQPAGIVWPPFLLTEAPIRQTLTKQRVEHLNAQFDPSTNEHSIREDVMKVIERHISNRPRSLQREIGPSEIGHECGRYVAYKLADVDTINPASKLVAWRPQIGVFVHSGLDEVFTAANSVLDEWQTEQRVKVAQIPALGGDEAEDIYGSGDLYAARTATVLDWKIVGPTTMKKVKAVPRGTFAPRGASEKYRIQGQSYGIGYVALGLRVQWITIAYLPAAGELHEAYFHTEPFSPAVAAPSIQRLSATRQLLRAMPLSQALELTSTSDQFCQKCPFFNDYADQLSDGCPGHAGRKVRQDSLLSLLPPTADGMVITDSDMPISNRR